MRETAAAREEDPRIPSMDDQVDSKNLGNEVEITGVEGVDHANVKVVDSGNNCFSLSIFPPLHDNAKSHMGFEEGLVSSNLEAVQAKYRVDGLFLDTNGLSSSRPRTTWTCINRMDFGLGGLARALTLPSLGKRDTRATSSEQDEDHQTKRGRVEGSGVGEGSDVEISAGVDSHPCWTQ